MKRKLTVFISHSHQDKEFARQLEASLFARNINTFLDERMIQVGDSIPQKVYDGIASSTHLIYVVSRASIKSLWVQEELSIAKMKEKKSRGFKILPVIIDKLKLPTAVLHLKYADFTQWRDFDAYRKAFLDILRAMQIEPLLLGREELTWYLKNSQKIRSAHRLIGNCAEQLYGAMSAAQAVSYENDPHYFITKYVFEEYNVMELLESVLLLLVNIDETSDNRLAALKRSVKKVIDYAQQQLPNRSYYKDHIKVDGFRRILSQLDQLIDEMRSELEDILSAQVYVN
jgi:hypothetical protein